MKLSTAILAIGAIAIGWIQFPADWTFGPHIFLPWLDQLLGHSPVINSRLSLILEVTGSVIAIAGVWIASVMVNKEIRTGRGIGNNTFLNAAWYIDDVLKSIVVNGFKGLTKLLDIVIERWALNKVLVGGISSTISKASELFSEGQTRQLSHYVLLMTVGAVLLLFYIA
jgi:NADH-quinone oxidoreductase subunit L